MTALREQMAKYPERLVGIWAVSVFGSTIQNATRYEGGKKFLEWPELNHENLHKSLWHLAPPHHSVSSGHCILSTNMMRHKKKGTELRDELVIRRPDNSVTFLHIPAWAGGEAKLITILHLGHKILQAE